MALSKRPLEQRTERRYPAPRVSASMRLDGRDYEVSVDNISNSGAALLTSLRPAVGTIILLDAVSARVVRHSWNGIAVEFAQHVAL